MALSSYFEGQVGFLRETEGVHTQHAETAKNYAIVGLPVTVRKSLNHKMIYLDHAKICFDCFDHAMISTTML